jgi:ketosteroid isomerase-like protein
MGQVPPTGRRLEQRYGIVHQFRNGKIASLHFFYDRLSLLQQLGLIGAPGQ